jgi:DNA invertase Pin-like site-specific DNA recombinase
MAAIAYLRVSKKDHQDTKNQRLAILEHAHQAGEKIDEWMEVSISSRKTTKQRRIDELVERVQKGDKVIVAELSRLGRSVGQIAMLVDELVKRGVTLISLKESIKLNGKPNISTKVQIGMFSLFAEIERDLISQRTKEGLQRAREEGKLLGRPKGKGKSKLDDHEEEIKELLALGLAKTKIAKRLGVHISTLNHWLKQSGIEG